MLLPELRHQYKRKWFWWCDMRVGCKAKKKKKDAKITTTHTKEKKKFKRREWYSNSRLSTHAIGVVKDSNALKRAQFSMQRTNETYLLNWFATYNTLHPLCLLTKVNFSLILSFAFFVLPGTKFYEVPSPGFVRQVEKLNLSLMKIYRVKWKREREEKKKWQAWHRCRLFSSIVKSNYYEWEQGETIQNHIKCGWKANWNTLLPYYGLFIQNSFP